ncbi:MAG: hypothetical protein QOF85_1070 [Solirubrobacterales bacterium]|jgi:hypothetical protein|nr:hypothetical protein [Solirubrobacterales bacterium]
MPSPSRKAGFAGAAIAFASLYLAAGAPTPMLVELQDKWGSRPTRFCLLATSVG